MAFARFFKRKRPPMMGSPSANDAVRAQLAKLGDDGVRVRHILHYAYPCKEADVSRRPDMVADLEARAFAVRDAHSNKGLVLEHLRAVAPDDFDALTAELSAWFAERGWDYDGWECAVASGEQNPQ
jgi:hypothetical protein